MPNVDEQLRRALREAAPRPTTTGLDERLARRRRSRAVRRRIGSAALAVLVLVGTVGGFLALREAFEGDEVPQEPSPTVVPGPRENGPLVVVVSDGDQTSHLEIDRLDGSLPEKLTEPGQELAVDPAASLDGRMVAFVSIGSQGRPAPLVVLDVETGERRVVVEDAFGDPSWSPDGASITYEGLLGDRAGVVTVDLATGERTYLTGGADPSWSPDGSTIAFELPSDRPPVRVEQQGIFTVPATGGEPTRILESGTSPSWSPDGSTIAFTRPIGVWVASADGSDERLIVGWTPEEAQTVFTDISYADPSWAPDGTAVVYTTHAGRKTWIHSIPPEIDEPYRFNDRTPSDIPRELSEESSDAAWLPLTDPRRGESTPTPSGDPALHIEGVPFAVCRVTTVSGDFGSGLDTAWVFEEEHTPGSGCDRSEGFQHLAVGSDDRVEILSPRLTDVLNDDAWRVWAYAAPDLNGDGIDEIAIARQGAQPEARHLWLFAVADGELHAIVEDCGPACRPAYWEAEIGPVALENGAIVDSGLFCGLPGGRPEDRDSLFAWQADTQDPLHVYLSGWRFDGRMLVPSGDSELIIDGTPGAYPPTGLDELCGSPTIRTVDFPSYLSDDEAPAGHELCNASTMTGDVDGDGQADSVTIGSVLRAGGDCPAEGQGHRLLTVDLNGDAVPDVESDAIDCTIWCFPFAAIDLSFDGKAEILVNEGHTAPPASAVIGVYELLVPVSVRNPYLEPVRFPDGANRFLLVNSYQGYYGAYCQGEGDRFTTWEILEEGVGGVVPSITFHEYRMDDRLLRFELQGETTIEAPAADFPPKGYRGYDGLFCGVKVGVPG